MMTGTALARMEPVLVMTDQWGITAVEWMALIACLCAIIDNVGRFLDKRAQNPDLKYDYLYLKGTIIAIALMGLSILGMEVVSLDLNTVITAIIIGFGGNMGVKDATKRSK